MMLKASEQLRSWLLSEVEREADDISDRHFSEMVYQTCIFRSLYAG
jgi:hypothetical protein